MTRPKRPGVYRHANPLRRGANCWAERRAVAFLFDLPDYATRLRLWKNAVATVDAKLLAPELEALADRFVLTSGADFRGDAASAANGQICPTARIVRPAVDAAALFDAARAQSDQSLGNLAAKVKTIA